MSKRRWTVEWRAQAKSDGLDRLGRMVQLVIDRAIAAGSKERTRHAPLDDNDDVTECEEASL
jgi:hypothetical protein